MNYDHWPWTMNKGASVRGTAGVLGTAQNLRAPLQALRQGLRGYFLPSAQTRGRRAASVQVPPSQTLRQGLGGCLLPPSSPSARLGGNFCRRRRPAGGGLGRSKCPPSSPSARLGGKLIGPAWHRLPGCPLTRHAARRTKSIQNLSKTIVAVSSRRNRKTLNPTAGNGKQREATAIIPTRHSGFAHERYP